MTFLVIAPFVDLEDGHHMYRKGDVYPREGLKVSEERIMQLLSNQNKARKSFIERVAEPITEKISVVDATTEQPKKKRTKRSK